MTAGRPERVKLALRQIDEMLARGRLREAEALAQRLVMENPLAAEAQFILGITIQSQGRFDQAEPHFARAVTLDGRNVGYLLNYGLCLLSMGRVPEAAVQYGKARSVAPSNVEAIWRNGSFHARIGHMEQALALFGVEPIQFFTNGTTAIAIIILALVWAGFGYQSLLLLAGLTAINPAVFEAAAIDGAGWWKRLWYITLPNIRRVLGFVFIINVLYTFSSLFGFIYVMTAGGPGFDTTTIDYLVYLRAFSSTNLGSGAALAVILFIFIGSLTLIQNRVFKLGADD